MILEHHDSCAVDDIFQFFLKKWFTRFMKLLFCVCWLVCCKILIV